MNNTSMIYLAPHNRGRVTRIFLKAIKTDGYRQSDTIEHLHSHIIPESSKDVVTNRDKSIILKCWLGRHTSATVHIERKGRLRSPKRIFSHQQISILFNFMTKNRFSLRLNDIENIKVIHTDVNMMNITDKCDYESSLYPYVFNYKKTDDTLSFTKPVDKRIYIKAYSHHDLFMATKDNNSLKYKIIRTGFPNDIVSEGQIILVCEDYESCNLHISYFYSNIKDKGKIIKEYFHIYDIYSIIYKTESNMDYLIAKDNKKYSEKNRFFYFEMSENDLDS